ncbi:hypothetical protein L0152_07305 [bacterium]|nr:hypothetical protein [bacterium]
MSIKSKLSALFANRGAADEWEEVLRLDALQHAALADAAYRAAIAHPVPDSPAVQGHYSRYAKHSKELRSIMKLLKVAKPKKKEVKDYFVKSESNGDKRKLRKIQVAR